MLILDKIYLYVTSFYCRHLNRIIQFIPSKVMQPAQPNSHPIPICPPSPRPHHTLALQGPKKATKSLTIAAPCPHPHKLYTPTIFDALSHLHHERKNSIYTLCSALHIYEDYCQKMGKGLHVGQWEHPGDMDEDDDDQWDREIQWNGDRIAQICYQISEAVNQCQTTHRGKGSHPEKYLKDKYRSKMTGLFPSDRCLNRNRAYNSKVVKEQKKLEILSALDWQIHFTTFIDITQQFFSLHKKSLLPHLPTLPNSLPCLFRSPINFPLTPAQKKGPQISKQEQLQKNILSEIEIVLEQWVFLQKQATHCAQIVIQRVLAGYEMLVDGHLLRRFLDGDQDSLEIGVVYRMADVRDSEEIGLTENLGDSRPLFSNIKPLRSLKQPSSTDIESLQPPLLHPPWATSPKQKNLLKLREKITLSQKAHHPVKPTSVNPEIPTFLSLTDTNKQNKSGFSTRDPSFQ